MKIRILLASVGAGLALALPATSAHAFSRIVAFGDSLSDNGNLFALTEYGLGIGLPQPPYWNGRFSNGPVAVEVLAQSLGVPLVDFAYGGAKTGLDNQITLGGVLANTGLKAQVNRFTTGLSSNGTTADASALYFLWGGANDFFSSTTPVQTAATAVANLVGEVAQLYGAGARSFLVPLLPDLSLTAETIAAGPARQAQAHALSLSFNQALSQQLIALEGQLAGADITVFDPNPVIADVRAGIAAAGGNVTQGCVTGSYASSTACAHPEQYFLWDNVHPTGQVHAAVGQAMAAAVPEPATAGLALAGLIIATACARRRYR